MFESIISILNSIGAAIVLAMTVAGNFINAVINFIKTLL